MMIDRLNWRLRIFATAAAVSLLVAASVPALAETPADTLVEAFAMDDIISMDPGEAFELSTAEMTANTYSLLVRLDMTDTSKVKGDLAESWTVSDDALTYTFKLKPGMTFASGNPIRAEDVAWSFERARLSSWPSSASMATTSPRRPRRSTTRPSSSPSTRPIRRASCSTA
jgi:peptide/nickel transport system substrate-binding protein